MTNKAYVYAKIAGIAIIFCAICTYFWSSSAYAMPSPSGILTIASAAIFLYFILTAAHLIGELEEQKDRK